MRSLLMHVLEILQIISAPDGPMVAITMCNVQKSYPEVVMSSLSLRYFLVRLRFPGMNCKALSAEWPSGIITERHTDVRKFECILNEEYWNVVAHDIPIAFVSSQQEFMCPGGCACTFVSIHLDRKASHVSYSVRTSAAS